MTVPLFPEAVKETIASDPRLMRAARSTGGRIAQFLAGAPDLLRRYQHAGPAAKAVLQAAIDILRLGHSRYLPEPMVEEAAVGYIDQHDWDQLDDDWYTIALDSLTAPHRRMPGPLIPHRPRPGDAPTTHRLYQLADFLEQHGRSERHNIAPPATFWTAARHARMLPDLSRLAQAAFTAGEYQRALPLFERAAAAGDPQALGYLSWLLEQNGDPARAEAPARQQADTDLHRYWRTSALENLALLREAQDRPTDAERLALHAAHAGNPDALRVLVWARDQAGHHEHADHLAGQLAELAVSPRDASALTALADERRHTRNDRRGAERLSRLADKAADQVADAVARGETLWI